MEKNLEKSLKRFLKKKVKITTAFIVAFLLGSLSAYGQIIAIYEDTEIKFYRGDDINNVVDVTEEIKKMGTVTGNSIDGFIWNIDGKLSEQIKIDDSIKNIKFEIINNGIISGDDGEGKEGYGNGIVSFTEKLKNNGIIMGNSGGGNDNSGNGLMIPYLQNLKEVDNNGVIKGNKGAEYKSGNGIYLNSSSVTDLNNKGTIKGERIGNFSTGNGIHVNEWGSISNLNNIGLIRGTSYGINIEKGANRTTLNNYGIIGGKKGSVNDENINKTNYGLFVKGSGADVDLVESGEKFSEQNGKTIINGITDDRQDISSLSISDLKGKTENLIINVAGNKNDNGEIINSFNVASELTLTNSTANGYENAVSLSNGKLTLNSTIINAGDSAVVGTVGDEVLNLEGSSVVNGNIDLGTGNDEIILKNNSVVNGDILLNGGSFNIIDKAVVNGDISTNDADVNMYSGTINGDIDILKGDVVLGNNILINGNINFDNNEGKIVVGENFSEDNFTGKITGDLTKGILKVDYQMKGLETTLNKHLKIFDGISIVQLKDEVNNDIDLSKITKSLSEIRGGNSDDNFTMSIDNFKALSKIDGGTEGTNGDTLTISGSGIFTNINSDGNIDDTVFDKIQNIENLVLKSTSGSKLSFNKDNINDFKVISGVSNNSIILDNLEKINVQFEGNIDNELTVKNDNGIFNHTVNNAGKITLDGDKKVWNFADGKITGTNVVVNVNDNGIIGFVVGKSDTGLVLGNGGVNPFAEKGNYIVNGDIKVTFDETVKFTSLSDKLTGAGNISLGTKVDGTKYNVIVPEFMKYDSSTKEFSIKSVDELKIAGLKDYAFGNYEHIILNYNNGKEYTEITEKLNTGSLKDIVDMLNGGITKGGYYFYSDQRILGEKIENQIVLGDIFIKTSEDTNPDKVKDTDVIFKNITGKTAELTFAENTTNSVSFLEGTVLNKIDGSNSNAGFTLNLGEIHFSKDENEKENETKVTMSNFNDILNVNSTINDISVDTGKGDDTVNILSSINGIFNGNEGKNILNIGTETQKVSNENSQNQNEITLNGEIKNFEEINLKQNTKLASSLKITGTNEIKLNGNTMFLEVDYSKKANEKIIGHVLYDNGIIVNNENGKIMVDVAKADDGTIISLGETNKSQFTNEENILHSGSSNHHLEMTDGDIVVKVNEHIMGDDKTGAIKYAHLDKVYQSIVSADKLDEMSDTTTLSNKTKDEAIKAQLEFYGKIYHSTPYAYSNDVSKKSADLITESIMNLRVMPEYKHWVFGGSVAGQEGDSNFNFYGSNYYTGIDIGKNEVSADTNIYGAYAFGKYGIGINQSVGFAIAGTRSDTDISGNSKLKGDAVYVSTFAEQEKNNLKLIAGISYQHSFYDATRNVSNDYQSMSVDKKYEDDLISVFVGGKYSYHLGNNFFLEPNVKLSVTHVMQDGIDEKDNGKLTIETDKKDFTFVEGEVGLDLVKKINLSKGILNLKAGTSLVYSLDGYEEEYLTGRITGATKDFEMISPEDDRSKMKFTIGTEYEMANGMFMNLHGNYTTSSHTKDYVVSFGAGYKF